MNSKKWSKSYYDAKPHRRKRIEFYIKNLKQHPQTLFNAPVRVTTSIICSSYPDFRELAIAVFFYVGESRPDKYFGMDMQNIIPLDEIERRKIKVTWKIPIYKEIEGIAF